MSAAPGGCLAGIFDAFFLAGRRAVPWLRAASLTVTRYGQPIMVSSRIPGAVSPGRSSLRIQLPRPTSGVLRMRSAAAGALDQFGIDLAALLDVRRDRVVIDQDLMFPTAATATLGEQLGEVSAVDRALGVLLDRGVLPEDGLEHLQSSAWDDGMSLSAAAAGLMGGLG